MSAPRNFSDPRVLEAKVNDLERELSAARRELARLRGELCEKMPVDDASPVLQLEISQEQNCRSETRMEFLLDLPLIGWREQMAAVVEYHPVNVSPRGMMVRVPGDNLEWLDIGRTIDLCLPFCFQGEFLDAGLVRWCRVFDGRCELGLALTHDQKHRYPVAFDFTSGKPIILGEVNAKEHWAEFLYRVIDDSVACKRTMLLYLGHLTPLLARVSRLDKSALRILKRTSLEVTEDKVVTNIKVLHSLRAKIPFLGGALERREFLTHFRQAILPEVDEFSFRGLDRSQDAAAYLRSIRLAERRLALHYNAGVLLAEGFAGSETSFFAPVLA